jgi:hypothetical protein
MHANIKAFEEALFVYPNEHLIPFLHQSELTI